jgi:hypothetical protein
MRGRSGRRGGGHCGISRDRNDCNGIDAGVVARTAVLVAAAFAARGGVHTPRGYRVVALVIELGCESFEV